ncbi:MAG: class F sortase [Candidatus Microsaccharimonas sp.]
MPLISLSATFLYLYFFLPSHTPLVGVKQTPAIVHEAIPAVYTPVPSQLKIASINVSASVEPVGLTDSGDMDIDDNPEGIAWYKLGPKPGEEGSAVLAGHYGWKNGVPSVFNDLNKLVKGDKITSIGDDGKEKTFIVTRTAVYTPNQDATDVFKSDDGKAHLNLITCQGSWNNSAQTYSERLVIFTDLLV